MRTATIVASILALGGFAASAAAAEASGEQVYQRWCVHCHSAGRGNPGTQSLQTKYKGSLPAVLLERTDQNRCSTHQPFLRCLGHTP